MPGLQRGLVAAALLTAGLFACGSGDAPAPKLNRNFLVVVENSLYEPLAVSLAEYAETMELARFRVHLEPWVPGTVEELKNLIFEHVDENGVEGALLIGSLPAAWYEQSAFGSYEQFPMDLYLQDRDAEWTDTDADGIYDGHSNLELEIYTSRLDGTVVELEDYFARIRYYRREGPLVDVSALIFIDDDWSGTNLSRYFLDDLYSSVKLMKDPSETTSGNYFGTLTDGGAEFVYQWIHARPASLLLYDLDEQGEFTYSSIGDIAERNLKASFLNLFNCSAARFTGPNLGADYTVGTDYGLAIIGSTKTGAVNDPRVFHESLVLGRRWGEAYQVWFNEVGHRNDSWHLGIVLMGDPLLRVTGDLFPSGGTDAQGPGDPGTEAWGDALMETIQAEAELSTFEAYREENPDFFND